MPPQQQRLIFSGRQMCVIESSMIRNFIDFKRTYRADDKIAKDFGIQPGAVLHLVLALRGGVQS